MCWHHPCSYRWCKLLTFLDVLNSRVSFLVLRPHWSLPPWWLLYLWHLWSPHADVIHTGPFSYPVVSPAPPSIKFWWLTGAACESLPFPSFGSHRRLHIQIRLKGYPKLNLSDVIHSFYISASWLVHVSVLVSTIQGKSAYSQDNCSAFILSKAETPTPPETLNLLLCSEASVSVRCENSVHSSMWG